MSWIDDWQFDYSIPSFNFNTDDPGWYDIGLSFGGYPLYPNINDLGWYDIGLSFGGYPLYPNINDLGWYDIGLSFGGYPLYPNINDPGWYDIGLSFGGHPQYPSINDLGWLGYDADVEQLLLDSIRDYKSWYTPPDTPGAQMPQNELTKFLGGLLTGGTGLLRGLTGGLGDILKGATQPNNLANLLAAIAGAISRRGASERRNIVNQTKLLHPESERIARYFSQLGMDELARNPLSPEMEAVYRVIYGGLDNLLQKPFEDVQQARDIMLGQMYGEAALNELADAQRKRYANLFLTGEHGMRNQRILDEAAAVRRAVLEKQAEFLTNLADKFYGGTVPSLYANAFRLAGIPEEQRWRQLERGAGLLGKASDIYGGYSVTKEESGKTPMKWSELIFDPIAKALGALNI